MRSSQPRSPVVAASCLLALSLAPCTVWASAHAPARSVVLATDIGDDIDDTWALVLLLKSPELRPKLILTDYGNTEHRARLVARMLEVAGRTDIPIGIGVKQDDKESPQAGWLEGYDFSRYPGRVHGDGVQALIDLATQSEEPLTLVAVAPPPSLAEALRREPRLAGKLRFVGMYGSLRVGYTTTGPQPEWNVRASVPAARALLSAPWREALVTPLDTCGRVALAGERYARLRASKDPLVVALLQSYELWCRNRETCAKDPARPAAKSSTLFDTVAVYLAIAHDLVETERLGVRVADDGMTVLDPAGPALTWATAWKDLDGFEEWLTARLLQPTVKP